jgi:hypothetical protein
MTIDFLPPAQGAGARHRGMAQRKAAIAQLVQQRQRRAAAPVASSFVQR